MDSVVQQDRVNMSKAEWQVRCDLAALYRITDVYGWTDTINTHMSARIPGEPNAFLINN
jgi:ribulose-5-phosphate 4-epimerase/fuculose-1-phosphate aldolase